MAGIVLEWCSILARWIHVIAAIMWIGDSLLFMWIDSHLRPDPEGRADVDGVAWLLHSGGYYQMEKRRLIPGRLPPSLRWFWIEATSTWLSGVLLLVLIYYISAGAFMVDQSVSHLTAGQAVAVGLSLLVGGWLVYDGLWRSPLIRRPPLALAASSVLLIAGIYAATHLLSARAAYIHVGAMLGTIMAANVWAHILPPQRAMLRAADEGREIDPRLGAHAKTRSTHNTYLTFPVIFLMLSQHFPSVLAAPSSWVVLSLFIAFGAGARHVMLVGLRAAPGIGAATAAAAVALGFLTVPPAAGPAQRWAAARGAAAPAPSFAEVRTIIARRCAVCHSETPVMSGIASAPKGVKMDTPGEIEALAGLIKLRAVELRNMPPGNVTQISDDERRVLGQWAAAGAPLK